MRSKSSSKLIWAQVGLGSKSDCDSTASDDDDGADAGGCESCMMARKLIEMELDEECEVPLC